jgi:hypothetical protein
LEQLKDLCCGSGIWVKKNRIRIRDEQPGSYFLELRNQFFRLKYLKLFDADPRSGMEKIRIWDGKKFGSGINIPNPQH